MEEKGYRLLDTFHHPKYNIETWVLKRNKDIGFHQVVDKEEAVIQKEIFHEIESMSRNFERLLFQYYPEADLVKWINKSIDSIYFAFTCNPTFTIYTNYFHVHGYEVPNSECARILVKPDFNISLKRK
ncbi:MAG: hypothetical protein QM737_22720 [Ferruginibacter sp.]